MMQGQQILHVLLLQSFVYVLHLSLFTNNHMALCVCMRVTGKSSACRKTPLLQKFDIFEIVDVILLCDTLALNLFYLHFVVIVVLVSSFDHFRNNFSCDTDK